MDLRKQIIVGSTIDPEYFDDVKDKVKSFAETFVRNKTRYEQLKKLS